MSKLRFAGIFLCVLAPLALAGCVITYQYDGKNYVTSQEALAVIRADTARGLEYVEPAKQQVGRRAKFVVPSREFLKQHGILKLGYGTLYQQQIDHILDIWKVILDTAHSALQASNLFGSVDRYAEYDTENPNIGEYDYLIWLYKQSVTTEQWYVRKRGSSEKKIIFTDTGQPPHLRSKAWVNNLKEQIAALGEEPSQAAEQAKKDEGSEDKSRKAGSGSGFYISKSGHVLTNHHVVDGCASLQVKRIGGITKSASLVAADDKNDLAVLVVDSTPPQIARFRLAQRVRQGEKVYAYGFPWAGALASRGNMTEGNVSALAGVGDDTRYLQITSPVQPGNSGGPLVGEGGRVIGVVTSKLNALKVAGITGDIPQNVNFALKDSIA